MFPYSSSIYCTMTTCMQPLVVYCSDGHWLPPSFFPQSKAPVRLKAVWNTLTTAGCTHCTTTNYCLPAQTHLVYVPDYTFLSSTHTTSASSPLWPQWPPPVQCPAGCLVSKAHGSSSQRQPGWTFYHQLTSSCCGCSRLTLHCSFRQLDVTYVDDFREKTKLLRERLVLNWRK